MSSPEETQEVERFRTWIERSLGLQFDGSKVDFLRDVLRARAAARGHASTTSYLGGLAAGLNTRAESRALAEALTVNETYFFRNPDHFRAFTEVIVPSRSRAHVDRPRLRVLSAGCASGEEAYSVAITLRHHIPDIARWDIAIRAVDVSPRMIEKAIHGRYSAWSLRETTAEIRERYFRAEGSEFLLDESIRAMVSFEERNLVEDLSPWQPGAFDVIFCRNVIMYLVPVTARSLMERLTGILTPGGFLFLGHAETLRGISNAFHLCHTHETFYYQRRAGAEISRTHLLDRSFTGDSSRLPPATALDSDTSWFDVITASARRVANLAVTPTPPGRSRTRPLGEHPDAEPIPSSSRRTADLALALELLRQERFTEALEIVGELPAGSTADPDTQVLRALLLTNCGEVAEAERVCREVLARDDLNAGAHYLMALCLEHAGDHAGAIEHDQNAAYLDPGFAMPRLHLGLLARREGDSATARRELQQALVLLAREDPSRVLFFGGGFNRESLVALCHGELRACEEAA
jgi:chemotaxis protein methyltransferase CheR